MHLNNVKGKDHNPIDIFPISKTISYLDHIDGVPHYYESDSIISFKLFVYGSFSFKDTKASNGILVN